MRGPFEGLLDQCRGLSAHERAQIMLNFLGASQAILLPIADLQVAGDRWGV